VVEEILKRISVQEADAQKRAERNSGSLGMIAERKFNRKVKELVQVEEEEEKERLP
jgi:hypothetical protein